MAVDEGARSVTVTPGRAAQELELGRDEFRLAIQLGLVRTVPAGESGRRRVERDELDRLKAAPDFPAGLRDRVHAIGTADAAALLEISPERFTRLARTGHVSPVRFSLNRYRAVVWTYLAEDVAALGRTCPALLTGRLPLELRERLAAQEDLRPRNWRARRLGVLLRATDDPWAQAAAMASMLDPVQVAEVVDDPYERAHLDRLRPPEPPGTPVRAPARDIAERLARADDPDEILWHRLSLALALDEARTRGPAPHPGDAGPGREREEPPEPRVPVRRRTPRRPVLRAAPSLPPGPPPSPAESAPPWPSTPPGPVLVPAVRAAAIERPPSRAAARAGLLARLRRRRTGGGRGRGRKRPVSWP
ncbi:DUF6397 family protein [Streptomyces venezuelae]|uniref:DUF6397 family protein n=1 Tax=Streptomyces sp. B6(2022) TaxID=3404749 RepID=UPI00311F9C91